MGSRASRDLGAKRASMGLLLILAGGAGCEVVVGAMRDARLEDTRAPLEGTVADRRADQAREAAGSDALCQPEICNAKDDDCDGIIDDGAPCSTGQVCAGGSCVVSPRPCTSSADCTLAGQSCVAGACSPAPCGETKDCPKAGQTCLGNLCTPKSCTNSLQCGMSQSCSGGLCSPSECVNDTDCTGGLCLGGSCPRRCSTDAECDAVEHCVSGLCR